MIGFDFIEVEKELEHIEKEIEEIEETERRIKIVERGMISERPLVLIGTYKYKGNEYGYVYIDAYFDKEKYEVLREVNETVIPKEYIVKANIHSKVMNDLRLVSQFRPKLFTAYELYEKDENTLIPHDLSVHDNVKAIVLTDNVFVIGNLVTRNYNSFKLVGLLVNEKLVFASIGIKVKYLIAFKYMNQDIDKFIQTAIIHALNYGYKANLYLDLDENKVIDTQGQS